MAEHLKLAIQSEAALTFLLETIGMMFDQFYIPESTKEAFKLPIPKAKRSTIIMDNYRGILSSA